MEDLLSMGFSYEDSQKALNLCQGNVEAAIELMLNNGSSGENHQDFENFIDEDGHIEVLSHIPAALDIGISQYSFSQGTSACTVIAASAMKYLVRLLNASHGAIVDRNALHDVIHQGVQMYNSLPRKHSGVEHLAADELGSGFYSPLHMVDEILQGVITTKNAYKTLIEQAYNLAPNNSGYIGVIVTKPPETVAFVLPPRHLPPSVTPRYIFFDSHTRPHLSLHSAYVVECANVSQLEKCLERIFVPFLTEEGDLGGFEMMMYNLFQANVFQ
eukprot:gene28935-34923_t